MNTYYNNSIDYHNDLDAFEARVRAEAAESEEPQCTCLEIIGDNGNCPVHGKGFESHGYFTDEEIADDYRERNDLYTMGMGG